MFSAFKKTIAGLAIGTLFTKIAKEAISMASSLTEVQNVVDTAFGSMSWKVERFAKNAITQFGMSELSAKKTASTYMAMARGMGITDDVASDMSITLAGLTGDVASFYNISQELADVKLKSVFTGETETLKDLGIVMTQTNLKQFALSQGINKNISDMTQAELTTLRYNYVLKQLSMAQGDFAKTSGSWANQLRILQEQFKQLLGIIGNGFIAVLTPVIRVINTVLTKVIELANVISGVFGKLFGYSNKKSGLSDVSKDANNASKAIGGVSDGLSNAGSTAKKASKEIKGAFAGIDELNNISINDSEDSDDKYAGIGGYPIESVDWGNAFPDPDTSGVDKAVDKVISKIERLKSYLVKSIPSISSLLLGLGTGFLIFNTIRNWGSIVSIVKPIADAIRFLGLCFSTFFAEIAAGNGIMGGLGAVFGTTLAPIIAISVAIGAVSAAVAYLYQTSEEFRKQVSNTIDSLLGVLQNIYNAILKPLFNLLLDLYNTILKPLATLISNVFVTAVDFVISILLSLISNVITPLASILVNILGLAIQRIIDLWNAMKLSIEGVIGTLFNLWNNVLKPIVTFLKDVLLATLEMIGDFIGWVAPYIINLFDGILDFLTGVFTGDFTSFINGFKKCWENAVEFIKKAFKPIGEFFSKCWEDIKKSFGNVAKWFGDTFTKAWTSVKNVFSSGGKIFDGIKDGILNGLKTVVNGLISGINKVVATPFNGLNSSLKKIKNVDILGYKPFDFITMLPVPQIPKLAKGGIAYGNSIVNVAEYAGARSNPEVIAPLDKLKTLVGNSGKSEEEIMLLREQNSLLRQILNKDTNVYLDKKKVTDEVNKTNKQKGYDFGFSV